MSFDSVAVNNATLQNTFDSAIYTSQFTFTQRSTGGYSISYVTNYFVGYDVRYSNLNLLSITNRYGFYISNFKEATITYTNIYSIYSEGSLIPMYHAGIGFFGTLTNLATTNVAMSLGKPINFENSTSATAGGNAGSHLIVYVNGVQRKIALLLP